MAARSPESFSRRAVTILPNTLVARAEVRRLAGFVTARLDEVAELYVHFAYRGTGVAAGLLAAAEEVIAATGHPRPMR